MLPKNASVYRVVFIGDSSVGKTSIISRMVHNSYNSEEQATVGATFAMHSENVKGNRIEMQIWDTAGQEKFRSLGPIYYRSASVGIVVADLTASASFLHANNWIDTFKDIAGDDKLVILALNKSDMEESREIFDDSIEKWSTQNEIKCFLTSARNGDGINEMMHYIANFLYENSVAGLPTSTANPLLNEKDNETPVKKNSCC